MPREVAEPLGRLVASQGITAGNDDTMSATKGDVQKCQSKNREVDVTGKPKRGNTKRVTPANRTPES